MLNKIRNHKGAAEGISWVVGLIAILLIVVLAIVVYNYGGLGKRTIVEIATSKYANGGDVEVVLNGGDSDFYDILAQQRLNGFFFNRDMSGVNKGIIIGTTSGDVRLSYNEQMTLYYVLFDGKYSSEKDNPNFNFCGSNNCFYFEYKNDGFVKTRVNEVKV